MHVQQCSSVSTLSLDLAVLYAGITVFASSILSPKWQPHMSPQLVGVHIKQHPAVLTGSVSRCRIPLYVYYGALLFLLDLSSGGVAEDVLECLAGQPENLVGAPTCYPHSGKM